MHPQVQISRNRWLPTVSAAPELEQDGAFYVGAFGAPPTSNSNNSRKGNKIFSIAPLLGCRRVPSDNDSEDSRSARPSSSEIFATLISPATSLSFRVGMSSPTVDSNPQKGVSATTLVSSALPNETASNVIFQATPGGAQRTGESQDAIPVYMKAVIVQDPTPRPPLLGSQTGANRGKKTLVLDLDETLVHSAFKPVTGHSFVISVEIDGNPQEIYVAKRPGVDEFLKSMRKLYEIVIFTASLDKYANPVIDALDNNKHCSWRLFRQACTQIILDGSCGYVKDLSRLGRDLRHVIIVDNSPTAYSFHRENAIPIKSWFDDDADRELFDLQPILQDLAQVEDVSEVMRKAVL